MPQSACAICLAHIIYTMSCQRENTNTQQKQNKHREKPANKDSQDAKRIWPVAVLNQC